VENDEDIMILSSLPYLEALRFDASSEVTRVGSIEVLQNKPFREIGLCHLPFLNGFSLPPGAVAPVRVSWNHFRTHQAFVAALLAAHHLNTGDGSVVAEVERLNQKCSLRFTTEALDTHFNANAAVEQTLSIMTRETVEMGPPPCLIVGAGSSSSSIAVSIVSSLKQIPIISPLSQSVVLNSKEQHPLFGRTCPDVGSQAITMIRFVREVLGVKHLGIVHTSDDYGNSVSPRRKMLSDWNLHVF
jgi:hypothetical protein